MEDMRWSPGDFETTVGGIQFFLILMEQRSAPTFDGFRSRASREKYDVGAIAAGTRRLLLMERLRIEAIRGVIIRKSTRTVWLAGKERVSAAPVMENLAGFRCGCPN